MKGQVWDGNMGSGVVTPGWKQLAPSCNVEGQAEERKRKRKRQEPGSGEEDQAPYRCWVMKR